MTTKVWNQDRGYESTLTSFEASRARLGLERIDPYLVHWPESAPGRGRRDLDFSPSGMLRAGRQRVRAPVLPTRRGVTIRSPPRAPHRGAAR
ncbi:MAG: hypothetical protein H6686_00440 [Fibrobacteria bacterium]|nr:hypothetical protein [Fibrobacteria bacterium]